MKLGRNKLTRSRIYLLLLVFGPLVLFLFLKSCASREPSYKGRSLSEWVIVCDLAGANLWEMKGTEELNDQTSTNREWVVRFIGLQGTNAVPILLDCLRDKDETIASIAARELGAIKLHPQQVVPALVNILADPLSPIRHEALLGLVMFDPAEARQVVPVLRALVDDPDPNLGKTARAFLEQIETEEKNMKSKDQSDPR